MFHLKHPYLCAFYDTSVLKVTGRVCYSIIVNIMGGF